MKARVAITALMDVDEVLLARQQRAAAETLGCGSARALIALDQAARDLCRHTIAVTWKDEAEEHEVTQQHLPVGTEPIQQPRPVKGIGLRTQQMEHVGAVEAPAPG